MAAVDFDLKFIYVLAGWEGSAHDALILADALERNDGFTVPEGNCTTKSLHICPYHGTHSLYTSSGPLVGKFYLVNVGYACCSGFLPPYRGVR